MSPLVLVLALGVACGAGRGVPARPGADPPGVAGGFAKVQPSHTVPTRTTEVVVTVTGTRLVINTVELSTRPTVADIITVFGRPDRVWDTGKENRIHTWDKLGALVYEPFDGRCVSLTFPFKPLSSSIDPATMFGGSITVDGKALTAATSYAAVKTRPGAEARYSDALTFDRGDLHVYMTARPPAALLDLVELSFWHERGDEDESSDEDRTHDDHPALRAMRDDCRAGHAKTCTHLALVYQTGAGTEKDPDAAFRFATKACEGSDAFGCITLGFMYQAGRGVAPAQPEARRMWRRACALGDAAGCTLANGK